MSVIAEPLDLAHIAPRRRVVSGLRGAPIFAFVIIAGMVIVAVLAPLLAPHDPLVPVKGAKILAEPAWKTGDWSIPLGTDFQGRDLFSRVMYGTRVSLLVGVVGTVVAGGLGLVVGVVGG
jgi:ABC-type dipeptide/oligopeptide/nickel transport system permease subunit